MAATVGMVPSMVTEAVEVTADIMVGMGAMAVMHLVVAMVAVVAIQALEGNPVKAEKEALTEDKMVLMEPIHKRKDHGIKNGSLSFRYKHQY